MDQDLGGDDDERAVELSSLAAIFPELVLDPHDPLTATLELAVTPLEPFPILVDAVLDQGHAPDAPRDADQQLQSERHTLSHLPPLTLRITLPEAYPDASPPIVSVASTWLSVAVREELALDCEQLWQENGKSPVLYTYIDHLQQRGERVFGLAGAADLRWPSELQLQLLDFDLQKKQDIFQRETFDCGVCLAPKKGIKCHRLIECGHVFCVSCLQDFFNSCITEGDVDKVKCLSPNCGHEAPGGGGGTTDAPRSKRRQHDRTLNPSELLKIPLDKDQVQRYVRLKRKKRLESDLNTIYCPRQWCQGAARSKKHPKPTESLGDDPHDAAASDNDAPPASKPRKPDDLSRLPMAERLSVCEDCGFAFCCVCLKSWHGEYVYCRTRPGKEIAEEEAASEEYLRKYSTPCPTCMAPCQKSFGCNHMQCFRCRTHFCYLCSAFLMPDNPYRHFNDISLDCYQRLWELEEGHGDVHVVVPAQNPQLPNWDEAGDDAFDSEDELPPEVFDAFNGARPFADEDDTDDEEPAPDQRRNMHIEIVNFAHEGGPHPQRFELPHRLAAAAPAAAEPPAAIPRDRPKRANRRRATQMAHARAERLRDYHNRPPAAAPRQRHDPPRDEAAPRDANNDDPNPANELPVLPLAAPGQGNHPAAAFGGRGAVPVNGIQRFIQLAERDEEDLWDSDELDESDDLDGDDELDEPALRRRARGRVMGWLV